MGERSRIAWLTSFLYSSLAGDALTLAFSGPHASRVSSKCDTSRSMAARLGMKRSLAAKRLLLLRGVDVDDPAPKSKSSFRCDDAFLFPSFGVL